MSSYRYGSNGSEVTLPTTNFQGNARTRETTLLKRAQLAEYLPGHWQETRLTSQGAGNVITCFISRSLGTGMHSPPLFGNQPLSWDATDGVSVVGPETSFIMPIAAVTGKHSLKLTNVPFDQRSTALRAACRAMIRGYRIPPAEEPDLRVWLVVH